MRGKRNTLVKPRTVNGIIHRIQAKPLPSVSLVQFPAKHAFNELLKQYLEEPFSEVLMQANIYLDQNASLAERSSAGVKLGLNGLTDQEVIQKVFEYEVVDFKSNKGSHRKIDKIQSIAMQMPSMQLFLLLHQLGPIARIEKQQCYRQMIDQWSREIDRFRNSPLRQGIKAREANRINRRMRGLIIAPLKQSGPFGMRVGEDPEKVQKMYKQLEKNFKLPTKEIWHNFSAAYLFTLFEAEKKYQGEIRKPTVTLDSFGFPKIQMPERANYTKQFLTLWDKKISPYGSIKPEIWNINFRYYGIGREDEIHEYLERWKLNT